MSKRFVIVFECSVCGCYALSPRVSGLIFKRPELPDGWTGSADRYGCCACVSCSHGIDVVNGHREHQRF